MADFPAFKNDLFPFLVFMILLLVSVTGNSLVVIAVWKKRFLRSTTNYLLVNLAVADIVNSSFFPLMLVERYVPLREGILADLLCKFFIYYHVPLAASIVAILTLVVLSVERYHAIVKPMRTVGIRLREDTVKYAILAVWISALTLTLPFYIVGKYTTLSNRCFHDVDMIYIRVFIVTLMAVVVFAPLFIKSFCYFQIVRELYFKSKVAPQNVRPEEDVRAKRKLVGLSLSVTTAFVLCYVPLAITISLTAVDSVRFPHKYYQVASVLYFVQAVLNPFLYAFQSSNFRQAFKEILWNRGAD